MIAVVKDVRPAFGPARDQGDRPTCLAFAASDAHAASRPGWIPLSCEHLFFMAQRHSGKPPTRGMSLSSGLHILRHEGQPSELDCPYLSSTPISMGAWHSAHPGTLYRRAGEMSGSTVQEIVDHLDTGVPVIVLMTLSDAFFTATRGIVVDPTPAEPIDPALAHAVVAVGYGTAQGKRLVLVRNSWGTSWGDDGHAWLSESYLAPRIFALAVLKEDLSVPSGPLTA